MTKKTKKAKAEKKEEDEKFTLAELVDKSTMDKSWVIYNLARTQLLEQYYTEKADDGKTEITPTMTIDEFNKIITGKQ